MGMGQIFGKDLLGDHKSITLNYQFVQGFILLDVTYERLMPLKFIFDTGAQHTILFEKLLADTFGPEYSKKISLVGSDVSSELNAYVLRNISMKLKEGAEVKRDILVLEEDFVKISELVGIQVHGIIGGDFFKNLIVNIDFDKNKIILSDPNKYDFEKLNDFEKIAIEIKDSKPYIHAEIQLNNADAIIAKFLLDTGAALTTMIQTNSHPSLVMPEKTIKSNLGHGLGGLIEGYIGKVSEIKFGQFKFNNFISYFQNTDNFLVDGGSIHRNGVIGNHMLLRFNVVIDYFNSNLYLKPSKEMKKEFQYDKSGLTIYAYGENLESFIVKDVISDSPSACAGIEVGDEIVKIGWLPSKFYTLNNLTLKLSGKAGKKIKLKIKRAGKTIKKSIILRDLL